MKSEDKSIDVVDFVNQFNVMRAQVDALASQVEELDKRLPEEFKQAMSLKRSLDQLRGKFKAYEGIYNDVVAKTSSISGAAETADKYLSAMTNAKDSIEQILAQAVAIKNAIDENPNIVADIETMNGHIDNIGTLHAQAEKDKSSIRKLYQSLFGYVTTDQATGETKTVKGLKAELDETYEALKMNMAELEKSTQQKYDKNIENWESQYGAIKDRVESLLPGAMSAGLAEAYKNKREAEEDLYRRGYRNFLIIIASLAVVAVIPAGVVVWLMLTGTGITEAIGEAPRLTLALSPVYAALIWLGLFQNKSLKTSKKLIEEYSHKEATAKTFAGLVKQIDAVEDKGTSEALRAKLLEQTLDAAAKNPSDCITNHEKSDNPMLSLLNMSEKWIKQVGGAENVSKILVLAAEAYLKKAEDDKKDMLKEHVSDEDEDEE